MKRQAFVLLLFFMLPLSRTFAQDSLVLNYDTLLAKVSCHANYTSFSQRANLIWNDGKTNQAFNATIRAKKDSALWMSFSLMGMEGLRTFITPDSFHLLNKLSEEYLQRPISFLQNWLSFPLSLGMLQQMITGEVFSIHPKAGSLIREDSAVVLYQETDFLQQKIWVNTQNYTVQKILLKDKLLRQDLAITFEVYNFSEIKPFSYQRTIAITRDTTRMVLNMDIKRMKWNEEVQFPFEVNQRFKKIE